MNNQADEALVKSVQKDPNSDEGEDALETIMLRYQNLIRMRARDYYLPGGESEDLEQEGRIGLYHAVMHFDEQKGIPFQAYADVCVHRQIQTAVRLASRKKHLPLNEAVSIENISEDEMSASLSYRKEPVKTPETIYLDHEKTRMLEQTLMECLTPFERQVLMLSMDGMGYTQIAELLGRTPKSVDNARTRARRKIRGLKNHESG